MHKRKDFILCFLYDPKRLFKIHLKASLIPPKIKDSFESITTVCAHLIDGNLVQKGGSALAWTESG